MPVSLNLHRWATTSGWMRIEMVSRRIATGIGNVLVILMDEAGQTVAEARTDENGFFQFDNLLPGNYQLRFEPPENFDFTQPGVDRSNLFNSDADPLTGITPTISLSPGENEPDWGAGLVLAPTSLDEMGEPTSLDEMDEPDAPGNLLPELYLPLLQ